MKKIILSLVAVLSLTSCDALLEGMASASQQQSMYSNFWNNASYQTASTSNTFTGSSYSNNYAVRTSRKQVSCSTCGGNGFTPSRLTASGKVRCGSCSGKGYVISYE